MGGVKGRGAVRVYLRGLEPLKPLEFVYGFEEIEVGRVPEGGGRVEVGMESLPRQRRF